MLGANVLGFHTQSHCNNFIETVERYLESEDRQGARRDRAIRDIRPSSAPIRSRSSGRRRRWSGRRRWQSAARACSRSRFGLNPDTRDRGWRSSASTTPKASWIGCARSSVLLESHPEWRGKLRVHPGWRRRPAASLALIRGLQAEASRGGRGGSTPAWGNDFYTPVVLSRAPPRTGGGVSSSYRAADLCIVAQPARRHESRRQGVRRRSRRRAGACLCSRAIHRRLARTVGSADRQSLRHPCEWPETINLAAADGSGGPARTDAGDARSCPAAQRLPLGRADAPRRGAPEAARAVSGARRRPEPGR